MNNYSKELQKIKTIEDLRIYHNERIIQLAFNLVLGRKPSSKELPIYIMKFKEVKDVNKLVLAIKSSCEIIDPLHGFSLRTRDIYFLLKQYSQG